MPKYATTYCPDDDDDDDAQIPQRRPKQKPRFIKSEFNVPDNYREFRQLGIPENTPEIIEGFLCSFPSHEEIARWEAKGNKIAAWLNPQIYELERLCLRTDALVKNFHSLEESEVLVTQLRSSTSTVKSLQAKLDDQLFPWLTKSNLKKYTPAVLAFILLVFAAVIFVKSNGHSVSPTNSEPNSVSSPTSTPATPTESGADNQG